MNLESHPADNSWLDRGRELSATGKHEEAIACFERAASSVAALTGKGDALFALGRARDSLVAFEAAIMLDGKSAYAWYGKGRALTKLGAHADAVLPLQKFLSLSAAPSMLTKQVSAWLQAVGRLTDIPSIPPPADPLDTARALRTAGKPRDALTALEVVDSKSGGPAVWLERARCHDDLGRPDLAHEAIMESLMKDPTDPEAWVLRARLERALDKRVEARRAVETLVRLRPRDPASLTTAASICADIGAHQGAVKHAMDALAIDPGNSEAWLIKARSDVFLGNRASAIAALRRARDLVRPDDFRVQHETAILLRKLGES
jgi:tetratricopeptide (TPR) repeat protein